MRRFSFITLLCCLLLLLPGCRSKKGVVATPEGKEWAGGGPSGGKPSDKEISEIPDPMARALVQEAMKWIGTAYRFGGESRSGTDCSGMVMSIYRDVCNVKLPRTTTEQRAYCSALKGGREMPGDLVFFGSGSGVSHVGMYIGNGQMVHASSSRGVMVSPINSGYWAKRFKGAGRVDAAPLAWADVHGRSKATKKSSARDKSQKKSQKSASQPSSSAHQSSSSAPAAPSGGQKSATPPAAVEVDLLDILINQKVDSIFSSQFMD